MMKESETEDDGYKNTEVSSFKGPPIQTDTSRTLITETAQDHDFNSMPSVDVLLENFEHVLSSGHFMDSNASIQEHHETNHPDLSLQIEHVGKAIRNLTKGTAADEVTTNLSQLVPKIIRLEHNLKVNKTLRGVYEEENQRLKDDLKNAETENKQLRDEMKTLQDDLSEGKRSKQDVQLGEFDFVTKKEANEIKLAENKESETKHVLKTGISDETHFHLQRKYVSLKRQMEEIVKVNHSWEEHYHTMKAQLMARIEEFQGQVIDVKGPDTRKDDDEAKVKQELAIHAALAELSVANQKNEKLEKYAVTLKGQRLEMEKEIRRLNEALAMKMKSSFIQSAVVQSGIVQSTCDDQPQAQAAESILPSKTQPTVANDQTMLSPQKGVESMTAPEMKEEIELLRQQTEIFASDFRNERQDRQRIMGELDAVRKDLRRTKLVLSRQDQEFIRSEREGARALYDRNQVYSGSAPQPRYGYKNFQRPVYRDQVYPAAESRILIAHGREGNFVYDTAGNDLYIDGNDEPDGGLSRASSASN